jgi:hypothetical protein
LCRWGLWSGYPASVENSQNTYAIRAKQEIIDTHRLEEERSAGKFFILYYTGKKRNYKIKNTEILSVIRDI